MSLIAKLTDHLDPADRARVEGRLHGNLIAWLTTVRPDGTPDTVPVWFLLRADGTLRVYTRAEKRKLRNLAENPRVSLALDVSDIGRNIVRMIATAEFDPDAPRADKDPAYLAKYVERMGAMFDTPEEFAEQFTAALTITPVKIMV